MSLYGYTTTPTGKFMLTVFGAVAKLEPIVCGSFEKICTAWKSGEISATKAREQLGMSKSTFYRKVKQNPEVNRRRDP